MAFSRTSTHIELHGSVLHARCKNQYGAFESSSLDLDDCIANDHGVMKWKRAGHFSSTARKPRLDGIVLNAECRDSSGNYNHSALLLDEAIENIDGKLVFTR